jgi:quercetin dioxygenase-like cupin family protein/mannose-6-phosphate isomerase-like protein (cupin superfamily)
VDGLDERPYLFVEHRLDPGQALPLRTHPLDNRSFLVLRGHVLLEQFDPTGGAWSRSWGPLDGWHAQPGSVYRVVNARDEPAVVLEAGTSAGGVDEADPTGGPQPTASCIQLDSYRVTKPWGYEIWYTQNLPEARYALKQIHMTAGHQSSLQSHRQKIESNHVIDGEATVLGGTLAPDDLDSTIDVATLPVTVHRPGTGWTSDRNVLHRVVARSDYTSVEVSTPELDDVIRWADDTGRSHGRIQAEHARGQA